MTSIPYDIFESDTEILVLLPLWWVKQESIDVKLNKNVLTIIWNRKRPELKDDLVPQKEEAYWWEFKVEIQLPLTVYFEQIKAQLTKENILLIIIPKYKLPQDIKLQIEKLN